MNILPVCSEQCIPLPFYAVMRIGALATQAPNVIQHSQVTKLSNASGFMASVKLIFHQFKHHYNHFPRGAVASWLVRSTPDRAVLVRALAGDILLCYLARNSTLTAPLSTQERGKFNVWGNPAMD